MRDFAVCDELAVPVDIVTAIVFDPPSVVDYYTSEMTADKTSGALIVETEEGDHKIKDSDVARKFIHSLETSTNIQGAYTDDLLQSVERYLE